MSHDSMCFGSAWSRQYRDTSRSTTSSRSVGRSLCQSLRKLLVADCALWRIRHSIEGCIHSYRRRSRRKSGSSSDELDRLAPRGMLSGEHRDEARTKRSQAGNRRGCVGRGPGGRLLRPKRGLRRASAAAKSTRPCVRGLLHPEACPLRARTCTVRGGQAARQDQAKSSVCEGRGREERLIDGSGHAQRCSKVNVASTWPLPPPPSPPSPPLLPSPPS